MTMTPSFYSALGDKSLLERLKQAEKLRSKPFIQQWKEGAGNYAKLMYEMADNLQLLPDATPDMYLQISWDVACELYGVEKMRLAQKTRKREVVLVRQIVMHIMKNVKSGRAEITLKWIGEKFGGFDHTTVIHSCNAVDNSLQTDDEYRRMYDKILDEVRIRINAKKMEYGNGTDN